MSKTTVRLAYFTGIVIGVLTVLLTIKFPVGWWFLVPCVFGTLVIESILTREQ
jgi:hypothetical protein